jgi:hypothetical protein
MTSKIFLCRCIKTGQLEKSRPVSLEMVLTGITSDRRLNCTRSLLPLSGGLEADVICLIILKIRDHELQSLEFRHYIRVA